MSMNEIRPHLVSKFYVVAISIFSHNWLFLIASWVADPEHEFVRGILEG